MILIEHYETIQSAAFATGSLMMDLLRHIGLCIYPFLKDDVVTFPPSYLSTSLLVLVVIVTVADGLKRLLIDCKSFVLFLFVFICLSNSALYAFYHCL